MTSFPTSREEFYRLRDDRTDRYVTSRDYQNARCLVTIDKDFATTFAGQVTLLTTCNLLSRWCRSVLITVSPVPAHDFFRRGAPLVKLLLDQMFDADPFGDFQVGELAENFDPQTQIHIGRNFEKLADKCVLINASGWYAAVSTSQVIDLSPSNDTNCVGAIAAACLGVSQVFKYSIGYPAELNIADGIFDLFRLERAERQGETYIYPESRDVGRVLMVGAGSIGSAAVYALRTMGVVMDLTIVDHDEVKVENFNRSPIFGKSNYQLNKAKAVAMYLDGSSIRANDFGGPWNDFIKNEGALKNRFDIWLPLANEQNVRWAMQNNIPPLMIHASTTQNWGVNYGRHIPIKEDCLVDRFPAVSIDEYLDCSFGEVKVQEAVIDAALPFLSFFGGLLVAADLVRLGLDNYPHLPNFALVDFGGTLNQIQRFSKKPRVGCLCQTQHSLHARFNGETRYYNSFS